MPLLLLLLGLSGTFFTFRNPDPDEVVSDFESRLSKLKEELGQELLEIQKGKELRSLQALYNEKRQSFFVYRNDSLIDWSDHHVPAERYLRNHCFDRQVEQLSDGIYLVAELQKGSLRYVALQLIKHQYPFSNEYIKNELDEGFGKAFRNIQVSQTKVENSYPIKIDNNNIILYINLDNYRKEIHPLWVFLFFSGYAWLIYLIPGLAGAARFKGIGAVAAVFLCSAAYSVLFLIPESSLLHLSVFFDPGLFAYSGLMPSLGHLLLFAWCLFSLVRLLRKCFPAIGFPGILPSLLLNLSININIIFLASLGRSLVQDSRIPLDTNNLLMLDASSFGALLSLFIFFRILRHLIEWEPAPEFSFSKYVKWGLPVLATAGWIYADAHSYVPALLFLFFRMASRAVEDYLSESPSVRDAVHLFLFTLFTGFILGQSLSIKQEDRTALLAENLARPRDPVAEFLFNDINKRLLSDTLVKDYLSRNHETQEALIRHISSRYLTGYWDRFDIRILIYDSTCNVIARSSNALYDRYGALDTLFRSPAESEAPLRYFSETGEGATVMAGKAVLSDKQEHSHYTLFTEFRSRSFNAETGFPALLLDQDVQTYREWKELSWAEYRSGKLFSHQGNFDYPLKNVFAKASQAELNKIEEGTYVHFVFRPAGKGTEYFIASMESRSLLMWLTFLTSLFALFSFFLWLWPALRLIPSLGSRKFDLRMRIRSVPVSIVLAGLLLIGIATVYFMRSQYEWKNATSLKEKSSSVLMELQGKFGDESSLVFPDRTYIDYTLSKFSNVLFCEINLFDTAGHLISSSRPQVIEEGLLGARMNPSAYEALKSGRQSFYLNTEHIGSLGYLSSYLPVFSNKGSLLGYLNLPYFSRQDRVESEISSVLVALLNIYVLILVVSVLATLAIANRITGPLNLLSKQISVFKLGRKNEPIAWQDSGDEISKLISEYNRMTSELAESASRLAESEREQAWREMARQVAHEIRNPLTPIRLQAQQLQRLYKEQPEEFMKRFPGFSNMLIEQIDTLARIAGDFRDFAQMPQTRLSNVNLLPLIKQTIQLFRNRENTEIEFECEEGKDYLIMGDHEQVVRVFNNLLQNAIQAIPEGQPGQIRIEMSHEQEHVLVLVKDNGTGIAAEAQQHIFTPNFTTKTSGMGLGLAMVKAIMDACGGTVSFRTEPGRGTTFVLRFPVLRDSLST